LLRHVLSVSDDRVEEIHKESKINSTKLLRHEQNCRVSTDEKQNTFFIRVNIIRHTSIAFNN